MTELEPFSKTPRELLGPEGIMLELIGVKRIVRVPIDMDEVKKRVDEKGLLLFEAVPDDQFPNWALCRPGKTTLREVETCFLQNNQDNSVWIPEQYMAKFQELLGVVG